MEMNKKILHDLETLSNYSLANIITDKVDLDMAIKDIKYIKKELDRIIRRMKRELKR